MIRKKISQTFRICMALMLSVLTSGILQTAPAFAVEGHEVVCHMEGNGTAHAIPPSKTSAHDPKHFSADPTESDYMIFTTYPVTDDSWPELKAGLDAQCAAENPNNPDVIAIPAAPSVTDPCGVGNATWDLPADTATLDWDLTAGVLTVTIIPADTVFTDDTTTHNFGTAVETNVAACISVIDLPAAPSVTDPCGTGNATWDLPADTATLNWDLTAGVLTVTIIPADTTFPGGATMHNFGLAVETNVAACVSVIDLPAAPSVTDPCGTGNATWNLPADTATLDWSINAADELVVDIIAANTTFPGGATTHNFGTAVETNTEECEEDEKIEICHATSAVVNPYNKIEVSTNAADGVAGNSGGQPDHFGEHTGAIFDPEVNENGDDWGDIIPPISPHHEGLNWSELGQAIYRNGDCEMPPAEEPEAVIVASNVCVPTGVKVTLTNSGDADGTANVNGTDYNVPANDSVEVVVPFDLGTPFKAAVTVTIGGVEVTTNVDCTPGSGGQILGDGASTTRVLPATLPATGDNDGPLALVLAMIAAYGAVYFLQGRRKLDSAL